ncbi:MAG: ATP-dependent DNA helicase RecG [Pseudobutyrivibrio sp.]|nr:ATP-dependent DNA helicase RecG [Pseudobutyrivibrio sp.]
MDLMSSVDSIKGIGEKTSKLLNKLGVYTIQDILLFFPRTYLIYPDFIKPNPDAVGKDIAILGHLRTKPKTFRARRGLDILSATVYVDDMPIELVWFNANYYLNNLIPGTNLVFYGKLILENKKYKISHPAIFTREKYSSLREEIQPVYHLTKGLSNNTLIKAVKEAISCQFLSDGRLPDSILKNRDLMEYSQAIYSYHFPKSFDELFQARRRLAYEEMFFFILNSRLQEESGTSYENTFNISHHSKTDAFRNNLGFELTSDQENVLSDITSDLTGDYITQRLIQGDVGSGKTIVAFLAMLDVALSGYQTAIMAPTEVLARQHYEGFKKWIEDNGLDIPIALFTGSMKASEKRTMEKIVKENDSCIIVGTHALISDGREYKNLALVIIDEQHRFGVMQRDKLASKGNRPHIIVMSATPIPRTLAMILYGNMHVSTIKTMPSNRLPIKTAVIKEHMRASALKFIGEQVAEGRQVYIICPLVEASETTEAQNVLDYSKKLKEHYKDAINIAALHGKMKSSEKNEIMDAFARHEIDILVSTTVVEVGVNVPNASLILIENANRFGLAALHQLRGRVGRGQYQSYCILMNSADGDKESERLNIMLKSNDGFFIAKEDLKMRGPGDMFGLRQSGEFSFRVADIYQDAKELEMADQDVSAILKEDNKLENHPELLSTLNSFLLDQFYVL